MPTSTPLFKVFCLRNAGALVKGNTYEVKEVAFLLGKECYKVIMPLRDSFINRAMWYEKSFFATQAEWRETQINSILNDE